MIARSKPIPGETGTNFMAAIADNRENEYQVLEGSVRQYAAHIIPRVLRRAIRTAGTRVWPQILIVAAAKFTPATHGLYTWVAVKNPAVRIGSEAAGLCALAPDQRTA